MGDISVFSPAMLKLFTECPAKFYYNYTQQIPQPFLDKNFTTGKNIHALASYYLKKYDVSRFEAVLSKKEKEHWLYLKNGKYFSYEVIGVEKSIYMRLNDFWIGGRIDSIVRNDAEIYILDYKTGGVSSDMTFDFQTMIYFLLCKAYYNDFSQMNFVYLDLKNETEHKIEFTDELETEYKKRLIKICGEIKEFNIIDFKPKNDCCCGYLNICRSKTV